MDSTIVNSLINTINPLSKAFIRIKNERTHVGNCFSVWINYRQCISIITLELRLNWLYPGILFPLMSHMNSS